MAAKIKLYVDKIIEFDHSGTYGISIEIKRMFKNIFTIFNRRDADDLIKTAMNEPDGISYMHTFGHFIVYLHLKNNLQRGSLVLFDCCNDMDIALDIYNTFSAINLDAVIKEDFMKQFLILEPIYNEQKGIVELTIEQLINPYS